MEGSARSVGVAVTSFAVDDRDRALLSFLQDNAGRPFTIKALSEKFGYQTTGSGSQLRKKLNGFLRSGYPVRRVTAGRNSGAMWCIQSGQLAHYAAKLEERAAAIMSLASAARTASKKIAEREMKYG